MVDIVQKEDPILRAVAQPVENSQISSPQLKKIIADMRTALYSQDDGVAIAAPQIGASLRIFMVSKKVFEMHQSEKTAAKKTPLHDLVCINPKLTKLSKEKHFTEEGCLSVRWLYGMVYRSLKATISATDEHGKHFTLGASGLLAQIFQHEMDHLEGVLFIDTAKDLEDISPEEETYGK